MRSHKKHTGKNSKSTPRPDESLREDAFNILTHHPEIDASDIEIQVESGVVVLRGWIPERKMKFLIEELVKGLPGVREVVNSLNARQPPVQPDLNPQVGSTSASDTVSNSMTFGAINRGR